MNYPESQIILDEIKKANKILINCHTNPDADSVGSAFAMHEVLKGYFKKEVLVVCPDDLPKNTLFIKEYLNEKVNYEKIDFDKFDFSSYDLFLSLDSSSWDRVRGSGKNIKLDIKTIVIDHHETNLGYGEVNLIDKEISSTAELLYFMFNDWQIDQFPCTALLTGIISDTECFRSDVAGNKTLEVVSVLMKNSDKNNIILNLYQNNSVSTLKAVGNILLNSNIDSNNSFCYTFIKYDDYKMNLGELISKDLVADYFINSVKDTNFGFVAVEKEPDILHISFRSRNGFDVSRIAKELGGGGHKSRAAAIISGGKFDEVLERVLSICRKYAK